MFRKNKEGMNITALTDTVLSALQYKNEPYTINSTETKIIINWKHHKVEVKGERIWFDGKLQRSVYNVVNTIKAEN